MDEQSHFAVPRKQGAKTPMKLLFGYGYLGSRIAAKWRHAGDEVAVVTRSTEKATRLHNAGFKAIVADVTDPQTLNRLPGDETVVYAVGFARPSSQSIRAVYEGGVCNVLAALPVDTARFIYISTTGVYGGANGAWIDETTPPDPQRAGGEAALAAEHQLQKHSLGKKGIILRLAGIYGPGRIPFQNQLQAGEPIAAPTDGYLNLIHVDDAADCVLATENLSLPRSVPQLFCISDGKPVIRQEFYVEAARQMHAPAPVFKTPDPNSPRTARAASNKRVHNARMLAVLRVHLNYTSHTEGLHAIFRS